VFLGSDNVGRVVTPLTSVGVHVAAEESYDVFIVRHPAPPTLETLDPFRISPENGFDAARVKSDGD